MPLVLGLGARRICLATGLGGVNGILLLRGGVNYAGLSLLEVLNFVVGSLSRLRRVPL